MALQYVITAASATQTLTYPAIRVNNVSGVAGGSTSFSATPYTVKTAAPASATEVQFTGTPVAPATTLTFDAALTASGLLLVDYDEPGTLPAQY